MSRLSLRLRLALAFALVMALVLGLLGVVILQRFEDSLYDGVDQSLRTRATEVEAALGRGGDRLPEARGDALVEGEESFAQLLAADGSIVDGTSRARSRPLLSRSEVARAAERPVTVDRDDAVEKGDPARLLAVPLEAAGDAAVLVVGSATDDAEESLATLRLLLALGLPAALLLASAAGYALAAAALRPVDVMRARAAAISAGGSGQRLPVPRTRDEVGRLGVTLNEMLDRLDASFERERRFVADASHELRTPLAILKAELELALREGRSAEELRAALRSAAEETERVSRLAEDLLVLARSDRGTLPLRRERLPVARLLEEVAARFATAERAIRVDAPRGLELDGDRLRLEQALGNLVANALAHGEGTVRLAAERRDGGVELHVRDEGAGLPAEFEGRAFERFTRADEARSGGGTGLGLAIVRAVARAHGGEAHARGADFWVELPA